MQLAALLRTGDEAAFKIIYSRYWKKLLVVAAKRLDNKEDAEEVLQDIFLNLWKRKEAFELKTGFDNYFAVAVKFEIINHLAKKTREGQRNTAFAQESSGSQDQAYVRFDLETLQQQLEHTISSLPPKCQLIFRMSREKDYTNRKIAEELQISQKGVEKHITAALKVLKSRFGVHMVILLLFYR